MPAGHYVILRAVAYSTEILLFAPLIVLCAYAIFGIAGFGSALIAVPLLAHFVPLAFAIPVVVLLDGVASVSQGLRLRGDVERGEVLPLLAFMATGLAVGTLLLVSVPGDRLIPCLGVLVLLYGISYVVKRDAIIRLPRWSAAPIGLFGGTVAALFGSGGPVYVMYFTGRGATPEQLRATMPVIISFSTVARIAVFALAGLFDTEVFIATALLLPAVALGLWIGNRLHGRLSRDQAVRVIGVVLALSGASLLLRAL